MVPTRVWRHYIKPPDRNAVLCLACWEQIVQAADGGTYASCYGKPAIIDPIANQQIHELDLQRGYRRFPPNRTTIIGLNAKDWRLVRATLLKAAATNDRLSTIAELIDYELRHKARFPKR